MMKIQALTLYFIAKMVRNGTAFYCGCGISGTGGFRRIDGGTAVPDHEYPWMVALIWGSLVHCGGSIITDKHVLTAGHCISFDISFHDLSVRIGANDLRDPTMQIFKIISAVKHPGFSSNKIRDLNDIAVLTLDRKIHFNRNARPICLPSKNVTGQDAMVVVGWGKLKRENPKPSQLLQETYVKVLTGPQCKRRTIYKNFIDRDSMMCAYTPGNGLCYGDSGGPLLDRQSNAKWYQFGIVSWGTDCASSLYPGVYVRVKKYIPWIKKVTVGGVYCL